jgi:hypothetical protein
MIELKITTTKSGNLVDKTFMSPESSERGKKWSGKKNSENDEVAGKMAD